VAEQPGQPTRVFIETVGCQMNVLDSELVAGALRSEGCVFTATPDDADTILFNTCSVRAHAEEKIYSALGRLRHAKATRPGLVIGVIGCMAQKDQDKVFRRAPHVDLICSPGQLARVPELIREARAVRKPLSALGLARTAGAKSTILNSFESYDPDRDAASRPSPFQAYVRIMMGCDKFCTFCIVPSTRGPEQSRHPDQIVEECRRLLGEGCVEITLLGQTVNSYKYAMGDGRTARLSDLLYRIHELPGLGRLKFVTNYPKDMTDDLLDAVASLPKAVKYLHVPLQHGCDAVLKGMKRGYTVADYREMASRCRERIPGVALSSDFIVGFPGEDEAAFQRTADAMREFRFKNSFIFKYSPREGTKAFPLGDEITEEEKKRRNNELLAIQAEISTEDNRATLGSIVEVLVEGPSKASLKRERAELALANIPVLDLSSPAQTGSNVDAAALANAGAADCSTVAPPLVTIGLLGAPPAAAPDQAPLDFGGPEEACDTAEPSSAINPFPLDSVTDTLALNPGAVHLIGAGGLNGSSGGRDGDHESGVTQEPDGSSDESDQQHGSPIRQMTGRTMHDRIVVWDGNIRQTGRVLPIRIVDSTPWTLFGEVVTHEWVIA
jgi:tRNA-2-methylthio-N6-dimethylallyladenosine synthase